MSDWQPIETAPKDGTWFLAACDWQREDDEPPHQDWLRIIRWDVREGYERFPWAVMDPEGIAFGGSIGGAIPSHWMPLPQPPEDAR
ncbi:hypothetical protein [Paracoccus sp. AS002]|uniref:hypothetical protein n=1 Tax=Paracoccus sp. AS002 TaxID=3019545 RepID=UPI0023E7FE9F|nr:hypothetical protein [Paracoccus sp. AS002]MDF3904713.1 hypothetical protein [Paracoccus sp. AS002]